MRCRKLSRAPVGDWICPTCQSNHHASPSRQRPDPSTSARPPTEVQEAADPKRQSSVSQSQKRQAIVAASRQELPGPFKGKAADRNKSDRKGKRARRPKDAPSSEEDEVIDLDHIAETTTPGQDEEREEEEGSDMDVDSDNGVEAAVAKNSSRVHEDQDDDSSSGGDDNNRGWSFQVREPANDTASEDSEEDGTRDDEVGGEVDLEGIHSDSSGDEGEGEDEGEDEDEDEDESSGDEDENEVGLLVLCSCLRLTPLAQNDIGTDIALTKKVALGLRKEVNDLHDYVYGGTRGSAAARGRPNRAEGRLQRRQSKRKNHVDSGVKDLRVRCRNRNPERFLTYLSERILAPVRCAASYLAWPTREIPASAEPRLDDAHQINVYSRLVAETEHRLEQAAARHLCPPLSQGPQGAPKPARGIEKQHRGLVHRSLQILDSGAGQGPCCPKPRRGPRSETGELQANQTGPGNVVTLRRRYVS